MSNNSNVGLKILEKYFLYLKNRDEVLKDVKIVPTIHGGGFRYENEEKSLISPIRKIVSEISYKNEIIYDFDLDTFCGELYNVVNNKIIEMHKTMFKTVSDISELTGNIGSAKDDENIGDSYLKMIEMIDISFDEEGNPRLPTLHVNSETADKFKTLNFTPEQEKREKEIFDKKKEEWNAKKRNRKLSFKS